MNIAQAKEQIKNTVKAYRSKDENGAYRIEPHEQRPVLLMGPPGIGKTAVVKQAAEELGINFISYSMTHHTRQSALGLPVILTKEFKGQSFQISEYTMSEIIASVYEKMEETGIDEGILFLDEINCVSETLTPVMLQFLQYKVFGRHQLPDGWTVVAAGNPPEYNRSAKNIDVVTLDRLKVIEIEPDYPSWHQYALERDTHPAVLSFLASHKHRFYDVKTTSQGRCFATARGWSDLAEMITVCEKEDLPVSKDLVTQYIRHPEAAEEFASYYALYQKYQSDYQLEKILQGNETEEIKKRAAAASFDERWCVLSMLYRTVVSGIREAMLEEEQCRTVRDILKEIKEEKDLLNAFEKKEKEIAEKASRDHLRGISGKRDRKLYNGVLQSLKQIKDPEGDFEMIRQSYKEQVKQMKGKIQSAKDRLDHLFDFVNEVWGEEEMLLLLSELTASSDCAKLIAEHGCDAYFKNAGLLDFDKRRNMILQSTDHLNDERD